MEHQNIALEVDTFGTKNALDDPSYNGAIIVSANEKVCWSLFHNFSPRCGKPIRYRCTQLSTSGNEMKNKECLHLLLSEL